MVMNNEGEPQYVEGFLADVTTQRMDQAKLDYLAHHDVLTGLANRAMFDARLAATLERAAHHSRNVTLLFVDLDGFKEINDSMGHQTGDIVLRAVAARLAATSRKGDIVARLGGDEFALVMDDEAKSEDVSQFVSRLLKEIARPMKMQGLDLSVMASIGVAVYPADGEGPAALVKNADAAMYAAKKSGGDTYRFFTEKLNDRAKGMVVMREALKKALHEKQFESYYQPEVRLADRRITSVEALVRWRRPEDKLMAAERFIAFAAEAGLAAAIDGWMLKSACKRAAQWAEEGVPYGRISVNLSAKSVAEPRLAGVLDSYMKEYGVHPDWLEVEVTEAAIMQDSVGTRMMLEKIADLGVMLTLDDFGRGDASLKNLKRYPIKRLKIDREFVKGLPWRDDDVQFCRAVLAVAEELHIEVVAEGVEKHGQEMFLIHAGCHAAVGNLYSPPLSAAECAQLLSDGNLPDPDKTRPDLVRPDISKLMGKDHRTQ
jgi:diguanylate cyclase (GGDEF)-like protein